MLDSSEIMVSICCLVYNHEKYLRKCLDGFIMQKTSFKYEILIHDDASTDHSADIIREYEKKYPDIIKPIYQTENQYSKGVKITWTLQFPRAKGKYIALCEGDDYWTDKYKLQKQLNALEKHTDCVFCTHRVRFVTEKGIKTRQSLPSYINKSVKLSKDEFVKNCLTTNYLFQTSSYFFRSEIIKRYINNIPDFILAANVGDTPLMLLSAGLGKCLYIEKEMSCYRLSSLCSWTRSMGNNVNRNRFVQQGLVFLEKFNKHSCFKYSTYVDYYSQMIRIHYEFYNNNYKAIFYKDFRTYVKSLPVQRKLLYSVYALFPFTRVLYLKLRYK